MLDGAAVEEALGGLLLGILLLIAVCGLMTLGRC